MRTAGIIAEYNPFHNGHEYHIDEIRRKTGCDYIVVCMSGDFVQRGTPALLEQHIRTQMALSGGADLVIEMPVMYCTGSAARFAQGGVGLMAALGVVDILSYGFEPLAPTAVVEKAGAGLEAGRHAAEQIISAGVPQSGISLIKEATKVLEKETPEFSNILQDSLSKGVSFPAARQAALEHVLGKGCNILAQPNNILALEYEKVILQTGAKFETLPLPRTGSSYHSKELESSFSSATAIRNYIDHLVSSAMTISPSGQMAYSEAALGDLASVMPDYSLSLLQSCVKKSALMTEADLDLPLHIRLLEEDRQSLVQYQDVSEALADRIIRYRNEYQSFSQFTSLIKSRDLTQTRIQRALLHILLRTTKDPSMPAYARILGFRSSAGDLLKAVKEKATVPVISKLADARGLLSKEGQAQLDEDVHASLVYEALMAHKTRRPFVHEYQKQIVRL